MATTASAEEDGEVLGPLTGLVEMEAGPVALGSNLAASCTAEQYCLWIKSLSHSL
jgi:hypothetical protein